MNRFASGLGGIKKAPGQPPSRQGKVAISAYFDPAVRKQLAILAVKEDRSQAALLAEALNLLFQQYGEPPIARA
ncbi:ribbon-helix-helix domain-containing protein [Lichenibacterium dinghuense]|uniref:ribbon-helix-helix domain-containing protein n=1 Tax=Lichenibacterium dinghuense TaxID=2895977 RepID=UPI001F4036C9|nr:ribbon-helix-helix domain-containing protein [Lichenibacterium sp. 6Y81]